MIRSFQRVLNAKVMQKSGQTITISQPSKLDFVSSAIMRFLCWNANRFLVTSVVALSVISGCSGADTEQPQGRVVAERYGCISCHGSAGFSSNPRFPNLAGQNEMYLVNQLKLFRGKSEDKKQARRWAHRYSGMMSKKAHNLSNDEIGHLARYFSQRSCFQWHRLTLPQAPPLLKTCIGCHGESGISQQPFIPNLAGQKQYYLEIQLKAFRHSGSGDGGIPDDIYRYHPVMTRQAARLADSDIVSLSNYYSKLNCAK